MLLLTTIAADSETGNEARRGFYFGTDVGVSLPGDLESTRTNIGIPTNCDQWLEAFIFEDGTNVPYPLDQCNPTALPGSPNSFDLGTGFLAGAHLGYAFRNFRIETEYFIRAHSGERLPLLVIGDPKQQEFVERSEKISDFRASSIFVNFYYDFHTAKMPKVTPFLGVGVSLTDTTIDYSAASIRTNDRNELIILGRNPDAAGTASLANEILSDNLVGYQLLAGLDYALSEGFYAGIKLRYGDAFENFQDGDNEWKPLRGHGSTVGPPGEPGGNLPVRYEISADNLTFWGVSLSLKYFY
ncbi:MAG: hypothetical protein F7O42_01065 [Opitutae bacterium]|nr:hypothetical protein [Opitutae bacterium]